MNVIAVQCTDGRPIADIFASTLLADVSEARPQVICHTAHAG